MAHQRAKVPMWKQAVACCCLAYFLAAWILPVFVGMGFNVLPFVHEANFQDRFMISAIGSFFSLLILFSLDQGKTFRSHFITSSTGLEKLRDIGGVLCGILLFTWCGAEFSPNLFGALSRVLPSSAYEETLLVEEAKYYGSRRKQVALVLKQHTGTARHYLVLSRRIFGSFDIKDGDIIHLSGEKTMVGVYVSSYRLE